MTTTTRAAIYARISHDPKKSDGSVGENSPPSRGGDGLGVQRQEADCRELADRLGLIITRVYVDNDTSAYSGKRRPGFENMLDAMKNGQFDVLLCWHTDRLYRSMKDLERLIDVADVTSTSIRTVNAGDLDLSTSAGRMNARILGAVARQESEHMSERRKRANEQKAADGKWQTANRPFGYTQQGIPLEPEATMIRTAVADVLAGKSIKQVAREWNASGITGTRGNKFTAPNVRRVLVNPRYAALVVHNDVEIGPGKWTPLIDVATHRGLVAYLSKPERIICTSFEKKYMGSGVYRCGVCGSVLRHAVAGGRNAGQRKYECKESNSHVVVSGAPVDELVEAVVLKLLGSSDIHQRIGTVNDIDTDALYSQRSALQARLDELALMFARGELDGSQLRTASHELRTQLAGIDSVLGDLARTSPVAKLLEAQGVLAEIWEAAAPDIKGKIIDELMVVTVNKATRKGGPGFDSDRVKIVPRD